jgi:hypothetical protein
MPSPASLLKPTLQSRRAVTAQVGCPPTHAFRGRSITRILIYKRTHKGDPDRKGCFGIEDCMGKVRSYEFDAVIGVGGIGRMPRAQRISGKVNWIGLGSRKGRRQGRGPLVMFDHFVLYEEKGPNFQSIAPALARRMYLRNARVLLNFTDTEKAEVARLLGLAKTAPPSSGVSLPRQSHCGSKRRCGHADISS